MVKKLLQKQGILFSLITILIVAFDQLTKYLILKFNPYFGYKHIKIILIKNTGAGFGILKNQTFFLGIISLIVAVTLIVYYKKIPKEKISQILFALFLGGVIGNLIDRFFRGYVIDFISFSFWPAFNIADSALTIAVIGLVILYIKEEIKEKKKN
ncbi:signal peptidase II [Candidatus Woesearchaeota archaeon]|jgi:signal peptidase II|nr:signal peptidase II [Candidatus Woesearchaeota archaeon]